MKHTKLFLISSLITILGSSLSNIALAYRFLLETKTGIEYGALIYSAAIAGIVVGPKLGQWIDNRKNLITLLIISNLLSSIVMLVMAQVYSMYFAAVLVFVGTLFMIAENAIIFKILPIILEKPHLIRVNLNLQQIHSLGFVFGPLVAPMLKIVVIHDAVLFYVDSATFLMAAIFYSLTFRKSEIVSQMSSLEQQENKKIKSTLIEDIKEILHSRELKNFFIALAFYLFAFSAMAYSLAIVAKKVSGGNELLYAIPLVSMFVGRILLASLLKRKEIEEGFIKLFGIGLVGSAIFIIPLSFINNIYLLALFEFFLGGFIALVQFSQGIYIQLMSPKKHLAKIATLSHSVKIFVKSLSIPVIILLVAYEWNVAITPLLGAFYLLAFLYVFKTSRGEFRFIGKTSHCTSS